MTRQIFTENGQEVIRRYLDGESCKLIAAHYRCTVTTVTKFLANAKVRESMPRGFRDEFVLADESAAIELFNKGVNPADILRLIPRRRAKSWLYQCFKRHQVELRGLIPKQKSSTLVVPELQLRPCASSSTPVKAKAPDV